MEFCANPCRARATTPCPPLLAAVCWLALAGLGCGPELDAAGQGLDQRAYAACLSELAQTYAGARYDSALLLTCSQEQCGGPSQGAADALADANGHQVRRAFASLSMLVVDVGDPEDVLSWACRYTLDPAYAGAFGEAFPNLALDLR